PLLVLERGGRLDMEGLVVAIGQRGCGSERLEPLALALELVVHVVGDLARKHDALAPNLLLSLAELLAILHGEEQNDGKHEGERKETERNPQRPRLSPDAPPPGRSPLARGGIRHRPTRHLSRYAAARAMPRKMAKLP